ncbi:CaiB/BaiF CoA transferase family protein [Lutimaribacter marinistellae]|uniref:CaiB/BaiF CoA transferase family protein n=1 Tax=Lutimaribacter marinistellae TaxID=1820329 RepID=A0ABV7TFJ0_9RHOB
MQLSGIRVVEIGQAFAGPFASEILAHLGADVIKIERPGSGDEARRWGPPFWGEDAAVFHAINSNKRSVALDLKDPTDVATCRSLIADADVLVHNLRPGALNRLGLGPDTLASEFPRLIYAEISAYGPKGPLKDLPGYEILGQAFGGVMSITGEADRAPVRCGPSVCDFGSGMWLAIGVLAAIQERHRTGKGGLVQTSLFETALAWTAVAASSYLASGNEPGRNGASHHLISPYGYFETETGPLMLACASDALFRKLAEVLDRPDWPDDDRFRDNPARVRNKALIEGMVGDLLKRKPQEYWFDVLGKAGVPCAPVNTISEALDHAQTEALGMVQAAPDNPEIRGLGLPLSFNGKRPEQHTGAPPVGSSEASWS